MYLWKWYDKRLMGWWNVRNSEEKGGWKYDISESQQVECLVIVNCWYIWMYKNIYKMEWSFLLWKQKWFWPKGLMVLGHLNIL